MPKNKKKKEEEKEKSEINKRELKGFEEHIMEPLFAISILVFILSILRSFFGADPTVAGGITILMFLSGVASIYFIYIYFKSGRKELSFLGIPLLIFITGLFSLYANQNSAWTMRDFSVFSVMFGIFLLFYAIAMHRIIGWGSAAILAITFSTLLIHIAPAYTFSWAPWSGNHLAEITDPYFYYKQAEFIVNNGYVMGIDLSTYPTAHLDLSNSQYLAPVFMGFMALILKPLGISTLDIAILYGGIFAAFTVLVAYLLMRDLFAGFEPYNKAAAVLFAFMLMLSPGFASKSIASNSEDDAMGMFLVVSSLFLFANSFKRKSILFMILAGFSFLLLNLAWSGYTYIIAVFGIFAVFYSIINFIHKKNCIEHIPYFIIPILISQLAPLILHARGELPFFQLQLSSPLFLLPILTPIIISFILEMIRAFRYGRLQIDAKTSGEHIENFLERHIFAISGIVIIAAVVFSFVVINLADMIGYIQTTILFSAKQINVIESTTAEQNALCGTFNGDCIKRLYDTYGIGVLFGLFVMIPILLYFAVVKKSAGAIFVMAWSIPMIYGVINKSQYIFNASVPIVALGSTMGVIIATRKNIGSMSGILFIASIIGIVIATTLGIALLKDRIDLVIISLITLSTVGWIIITRGAIVETIIGLVIGALLSIALLGNVGLIIISFISIAVIGSIMAVCRKDIETFRVISLIILVGVPVIVSMGGAFPLLDPFGGSRQMQFGGSNVEAVFWDPTLQWLKTTPNDTVILTWWDYGHIITAVSGRISILDNLKGNQPMIQEVAKFHVLETNETKALDIARKYSADYVIIDWTMIGKSGAPHFIATSNITTNEGGEYMGYSQCGFSPENSLLKPKLSPNSEGGFDSIRKIIFMCNIAGPHNEYIGAIIFDITNDRLTGISVSPITATERGLVLDQPILWNVWKQEKKASILGIQSLREIIGNSLNYGTERYIGFPTFKTLIYVPEKFNDYMMTKLYLGDHMEEYKQFGLTDINRPEHFKLVDGFLGDKQDNSYFGYVRAYKINYLGAEVAGNFSGSSTAA